MWEQHDNVLKQHNWNVLINIRGYEKDNRNEQWRSTPKKCNLRSNRKREIQIPKVGKTLQISYAGKVFQILTNRPDYNYGDQEVLVTCDTSGSVSAWFHGHLLILEEVQKRSRQTTIVSSKSKRTSRLPPAHDRSWWTYGKKINGQAVLTTLSTQQDISKLLRLGHF